MPKTKSKSTILVADGSGEMQQVQDRRFEAATDWPVRFEVPSGQADTWLRYFNAECERRGWNSSGIGQIEARENRGSIRVTAATGTSRNLLLSGSESPTGQCKCAPVNPLAILTPLGLISAWKFDPGNLSPICGSEWGA